MNDEKDRDQIKEDFIEEVDGNVSATLKGAAKVAGVSYRTILRWRNSDPEFDKRVEKAISSRDHERVSVIEDKIFKRIFEGDAAASVTIFWLKANSEKYRNADKRIHEEEGGEDSPEQRRKADEMLDEFEEEHDIPAVPEERDMDLSEAEDIVENV